MTNIEPILQVWDTGLFELKIALEGTPREDLWRRPHTNLLSIGEIAGHIAYGLVSHVFCQSNAVQASDLPVQSVLLDEQIRYFTVNIKKEFVADLNVESIIDDLENIFSACRDVAASHAMEDSVESHWETWGALANYQAFHIAYHTGQIYSVRHMFGHETEDN